MKIDSETLWDIFGVIDLHQDTDLCNMPCGDFLIILSEANEQSDKRLVERIKNELVEKKEINDV